MSILASLIGVQRVEAMKGDTFEWLNLEASDGSCCSVYMPYATAVAMADAFNGVTREEQHGDAACGGDLA